MPKDNAYVELVERLNQPTQCKVWRNGVLVFVGQDNSALLEVRNGH